LLREMSDAGVTHVVIEVSSHSLAQQRLAGVSFDVAVFTNLSRDHLDYHENMDTYFDAKYKLFNEYLKPLGIAVVVEESGERGKSRPDIWGRKLVNRLRDDKFVAYPAQGKKRSYMTCGFDQNNMVQAGNVKQGIDGLSCTIAYAGKQIQVQSELIGMHNISNMLAATCTGIALDMDYNNILTGLEKVRKIPGRLERVVLPEAAGADNRPRVFVDYAHTPDALENVLKTMRAVTTGRLFCVFGCGGDRDSGKRAMMGTVAAKIADGVLITTDNPRSENPEDIIFEIEKGLELAGLQKIGLEDFFALQKQAKGYAVIQDRRLAIHQVCSRAGSRDVVLIAGKGHETYQITASGKHFFDDRVEARTGSLNWTVDHLVAATSGKKIQQGKNALLGQISTDTRSLNPGDVFVALIGDNFDGHDYLDKAVQKGAAAVVVEKEGACLDEDTAIIQVADTLLALGDLAYYRRQALASNVKVIGITGSSGKTTVKELTASIFEVEFARNPGQSVLKTQGNLNNLIGLPLSLLKIDSGHQVAIMEMGMNRPGEIERLAQIADPEIGCITNVQAAHLEGLGSIEGVGRAKAELFATMSDQGVRVVNFDDPLVRKLRGAYGDNIIGFAVTPDGRRFKPAISATRIVNLGEAGMRFTLHINRWRKRLTIPATGAHNVANCAAAAAIATAAGIAPEIIANGLVSYSSGDKRLQLVDLPGGVQVVNDSYNANPASMAAALKTVIKFGKRCKRVALLGDMFELGQSADKAHRELGTLVAELGFDYLGVTGKFAGTVAGMAVKSGMEKSTIKTCSDKEVMAEWVARLISQKKICQGDWLLIKGSRGMQMEQVLHSLVKILTPGKN
jgi:murE/murF fusion protein